MQSQFGSSGDTFSGDEAEQEQQEGTAEDNSTSTSPVDQRRSPESAAAAPVDPVSPKMFAEQIAGTVGCCCSCGCRASATAFAKRCQETCLGRACPRKDSLQGRKSVESLVSTPEKAMSESQSPRVRSPGSFMQPTASYVAKKLPDGQPLPPRRDSNTGLPKSPPPPPPPAAVGPPTIALESVIFGYAKVASGAAIGRQQPISADSDGANEVLSNDEAVISEGERVGVGEHSAKVVNFSFFRLILQLLTLHEKDEETSTARLEVTEWWTGVSAARIRSRLLSDPRDSITDVVKLPKRKAPKRRGLLAHQSWPLRNLGTKWLMEPMMQTV